MVSKYLKKKKQNLPAGRENVTESDRKWQGNGPFLCRMEADMCLRMSVARSGAT